MWVLSGVGGALRMDSVFSEFIHSASADDGKILMHIILSSVT